MLTLFSWKLTSKRSSSKYRIHVLFVCQSQITNLGANQASSDRIGPFDIELVSRDIALMHADDDSKRYCHSLIVSFLKIEMNVCLLVILEVLIRDRLNYYFVPVSILTNTQFWFNFWYFLSVSAPFGNKASECDVMSLYYDNAGKTTKNTTFVFDKSKSKQRFDIGWQFVRYRFEWACANSQTKHSWYCLYFLLLMTIK